MSKISPTALQKMSPNGTLIIDDTDAHTGLTVIELIATSDTILSTCSGKDANDETVDFLGDEYNYGTLKAGDPPIILKDGYQINNITLTSGRVYAYLF